MLIRLILTSIAALMRYGVTAEAYGSTTYVGPLDYRARQIYGNAHFDLVLEANTNTV